MTPSTEHGSSRASTPNGGAINFGGNRAAFERCLAELAELARPRIDEVAMNADFAAREVIAEAIAVRANCASEASATLM